MRTATTIHAVLKNVIFTIALCTLFIASLDRYAPAQTGYAVGYNGTILGTEDGDNWKALQNPSGRVPIVSVASRAKDVSKIWVITQEANKKGDPASRIHFANNGLTGKEEWNQQLESEELLRAIHFGSADNGIAVGDSGTIFFTDKGGANWTASKNKEKNWTGNNLKDVLFLDKDKLNAWAAGDEGTILMTGDGGKTWKAFKNLPPPAAKSNFKSISIVDKDTWWFVAPNGVLWTTNGGKVAKDWIWAEITFGGLADIQALKDKKAANVWVVGTTAQSNPQHSYILDNQGWGMQKGSWQFLPDQLTYRTAGMLRGLAFIGPVAQPNGWIIADKGIFRDNFDGVGWTKKWGPGSALLKIVMFPPKKKKNEVKLDPSTSPDSGSAGLNYLSVTGSGFPNGNINPQNVVVELTTACIGAASATTSAVSIVSGSGGTELLSFLLPTGLAPGQYFISISDSEDSDANFESSNCSAVTVSQ